MACTLCDCQLARTATAITSASHISLVPLFGVASSVLVLGESLDASLLVGGALAVAGLVLTNRARR